MSNKNSINTSLTISRPQGGGRDESIRICIKDEQSRARFIELEIGLADFTLALTGLSEVKCSAIVRDLAVVGKRKTVESRSIICPIDYRKKQELSDWLLENAKEDGWEIDTYLGSQHSVVHQQDGARLLNYRVFRYENVEPE